MGTPYSGMGDAHPGQKESPLNLLYCWTFLRTIELLSRRRLILRKNQRDEEKSSRFVTPQVSAYNRLTGNDIQQITLLYHKNDLEKIKRYLSLRKIYKAFKQVESIGVSMTPRWRNIKRVSEGITRYVGAVARKKRKKDRKIGLLIDGPNILRKEFGINLDDLKAILEDMGDVRIGKVLLNQYASQGLIEAIANQGFDSIVVAGDTDVRMGIEAMELIYNETVDTIALASRDADFLPILVKSKEYGKDTIVIGAEPGFSIALQNAADTVILMGSNQPLDSGGEEEDLEV